MTKIAMCRTCGEYVSEQWSRKESCPSCGGIIEREDVDLGPAQMIPRLLNVLGVLLIIISLAVILMFAASSGLERSNGAVLMVLTVIGALMFLSSLYFQYDLGRKAEKVHMDPTTRRKEKRLRSRPGDRRGPVRTGRVEGPGKSPQKASKIPVRK